jgi:hypothetical protein
MWELLSRPAGWKLLEARGTADWKSALLTEGEYVGLAGSADLWSAVSPTCSRQACGALGCGNFFRTRAFCGAHRRAGIALVRAKEGEPAPTGPLPKPRCGADSARWLRPVSARHTISN